MTRSVFLFTVLTAASFASPLAPSRDAERLREGFEATRAGGLPAGWRAIGGSWGVEEGELVGNHPGGEAAIILPVEGLDGVQVELRARFLAVKEKTRWLGVRFGARPGGPLRYHQFTLRQDARRRNGVEYAARRSDGSWSVRATGSAKEALPLGAHRRLRLQAGGGRVRLWVGEQLAVDSPLGRDVGAGSIGLAVSSARVGFDDVAVRDLSAAEIRALRVPYGPLRDVAVIAHRGASREAPENTLAALRRATERGVTGAEFDVHRTRDGEIVLMHDSDVTRTTNFPEVFPSGKKPEVAKLTYPELRRLDAGSWKSPASSGEPVPLLKEALELLRGKAVPVIEIKPEGIGREVARVVREAGAAADVFVQSFSPRAVREFREELPEVTTGFLTGERVSVDETVRARRHLREARLAGANAVVCHFGVVGPEYIRRLHGHGVSVWVYTVNDPELWDVLIRLGVDGIISDVPGELVSFVRSSVAAAGR